MMTNGLTLWNRGDVARLLAMASRAAVRYDGQFGAGYLAAVADLSVAFGVPTSGAIGVQVVDSDSVRVPAEGWMPTSSR